MSLSHIHLSPIAVGAEIVSIESAHINRLADRKEAIYILWTVGLKLIQALLAGGIGVNLVLTYYHPQPYYLGTNGWGSRKNLSGM